jgi:hypothetical protein
VQTYIKRIHGRAGHYTSRAFSDARRLSTSGSGSDIAVHDNKPENVVAQVRHWLNGRAHSAAASPSQIWAAFNEFMSDNDAGLTRVGFSRQDIEQLPINELMRHMKRRVAARP